MQNQLTPELVVMAIEAGMLDDSLQAIEATLDARKEIIQKRKAAALNKGDEFIIVNCSPKKWVGERVTFDKHDGMWLVCKYEGRNIRLRASHVGTIMSRA